ncbi:phage minor tail protein G, partial [Escherichia coli]
MSDTPSESYAHHLNEQQPRLKRRAEHAQTIRNLQVSVEDLVRPVEFLVAMSLGHNLPLITWSQYMNEAVMQIDLDV